MNCQTFSTGLSSGDFGGKRINGDVGRDSKPHRHMPAGLNDEEHGVSASQLTS